MRFATNHNEKHNRIIVKHYENNNNKVIKRVFGCSLSPLKLACRKYVVNEPFIVLPKS